MIPHHPPGEPATPADREHLNGLWKWKSLPYPTPPLCCPISTLFSFKFLPGSNTKLQTRARGTFYRCFLYPLVLYFSESTPASRQKACPKGFHPQTPQQKLRALSHCFRLTVSSDIGRNRGRIHHWALQGMVNLLETGSVWAETHKISSVTQNCRSRCVYQYEQVANLSRMRTNTDFILTLAMRQHLRVKFVPEPYQHIRQEIIYER